MYKVQLDVFHTNCWGSDVSLTFPGHKISIIDTRWVKKDITELLLFKGDCLQFDDILLYFKKRKDIRRVDEISRSDEELYIRVVTRNIKEIHNFSDIFFEHHCFPVAPIKLEDGYEKWVLGTAKKNNITSVYEIIKRLHKTKLTYVKKDGMRTNLTNKQLEALNYAKHFGYYESPRRHSVTEICNLIGVSKTTFLSHLHKAESKIILSYLGE